jgi:hypothetical protein
MKYNHLEESKACFHKPAAQDPEASTEHHEWGLLQNIKV